MDSKSFCTFLVVFVFVQRIGGKARQLHKNVDNCLIYFSHLDSYEEELCFLGVTSSTVPA